MELDGEEVVEEGDIAQLPNDAVESPGNLDLVQGHFRMTLHDHP